jgi:hypothetical protein
MSGILDRPRSAVVDAAIVVGGVLSLLALGAAILLFTPRCTPGGSGFTIGNTMLLAGCPDDRSDIAAHR